MKDTYKEIEEQAISWTKEAGDYIKEKMKDTYTIETKSNENDLVTDIDKNVENFYIERISKKYPDHQIMGEEGSAKNVKNLNGIVWILDPIDGTVNFVHQKRNFAISLGIFLDGKPLVGIVYDVMTDEFFTSFKDEGAYLNGEKIPKLVETSIKKSILSFNTSWILDKRELEQLTREARGVRSYGVAAIELAYVATGRTDAYISYSLNPWDVAGGYAILLEVGGKMTNVKGKEWSFLENDTMIAANPFIYNSLVEILNK